MNISLFKKSHKFLKGANEGMEVKNIQKGGIRLEV